MARSMALDTVWFVAVCNHAKLTYDLAILR